MMVVVMAMMLITAVTSISSRTASRSGRQRLVKARVDGACIVRSARFPLSGFFTLENLRRTKSWIGPGSAMAAAAVVKRPTAPQRCDAVASSEATLATIAAAAAAAVRQPIKSSTRRTTIDLMTATRWGKL